jgi:amino acid transporter
VFAVGASSPMTVLAGGVVATYAGTGVLGVPLSFLVLAAALALLTVGYVAVSRHVGHAATCYAVLAHGLGRAWGVAGAAVALVAYNAIQISLYGLVGVTLAGWIGGPWFAWAGLVWLLIAVLGVRHVQLSARVLAGALIAEIAMIVLFDLGAFTHPVGGFVSAAPLSPARLFVDGVGGVLALGVAAFVGYESGPVYAEEVRGGEALVGRATFATLGFLGVFYAVSSWALAVAVGPNRVVDEARDPNGGLPFSVLARLFGPAVSAAAMVLLVTSIVAAMLSFHNGVARYLFALGRERVVPAWLTRHAGSGAPIGGSLVQSATAAAVIVAVAVIGIDPFAGMFTWLSAVGAVGVLGLLVAASWAAVCFFRAGGGRNEGVWTRRVAPSLGMLVGVGVLATMVINLDSLLGLPSGSSLGWAVPGMVVAAGFAGLGWGLVLRRRRPMVYAGIGHGRPHPLAVLDQRLAEIEV